MQFKKAERKKAKLRLALCSPSGGGKTFSALKIAQGLGGKIALIDTERGSSELYSHLCDFDVCQIEPPFLPENYIKAIRIAENAGYDVIIIDSLSHAWAGTGGLLEEVDNRKGKGNDFAAWRSVTPMHNSLVDSMLQSPAHIIGTMRTKTAYDMVKDDRTGKVKPVKIGLAPIQRDGIEYEFTVVLDIDLEKHVATASKDRTGLFDGKYFIPTVETGKELLAWLEDGKEVVPYRSNDEPRRLDMDSVANTIHACTSLEELDRVVGDLGIYKGHPDSQEVSDLYHKRKKTLEADKDGF